LAELGVQEVAPGVLNGEISQIHTIGKEVIPVVRNMPTAKWWEAV
jgi:hypothetical protein